MIRRAALPIAFGLLSAGCFQGGSFGPSPAPSGASEALVGSWSSVQSAPATAGGCSAFSWAATAASDDTVTGPFTATCFGNMPVSGTAHGTISGGTIAWTATATAMGAGATNCSVALTGSARLDTAELVIPYAGTTCVGPASGTETIKRNGDPPQ